MNESETEVYCFNALRDRVELSYLQSISITAFICCLSPAIVVVNVILCIALCKTKQFKKQSQRFVIILAISDFFVGCISVPMLVIDFSVLHATRNCAYEKASLFVAHFNTRLTAYVIFLIGLDRYLNINPSLATKSKLNKGIESTTGFRTLTTLVILICAVQGSIPIIEFENRRLPDNISAGLDLFIYLTYLVIYLRLYWKIKLFTRSNSLHLNVSDSLGYRPRYIKNLVKTVLYLLLTVGFCYLPYVAVKFSIMYIKHKQGKELSRAWHYIHYWSFQPIIANSFFNTIIILNRNSVLKSYVIHVLLSYRPGIVEPSGGDKLRRKSFDSTHNQRRSTLDPTRILRTVKRGSINADTTNVEQLMIKRKSRVTFVLEDNNMVVAARHLGDSDSTSSKS